MNLNFLPDCSIRVTALLEYLDLAFLHVVGICTVSLWFWIGFFYTTSRVLGYASNQITCLRFMTTFVVWWKPNKKKPRRNSANIRKFISRLKFRMWGDDVVSRTAGAYNLTIDKRLARRRSGCARLVMTLAGMSTAKISWFRWSVTELGIRENRIIVLPVNNSRVWCADFLGRTTHLDMYFGTWLHVYSNKTHNLLQNTLIEHSLVYKIVAIWI